nr:RES domain-containing protein [uncultured Mucilaginibacter sp.]
MAKIEVDDTASSLMLETGQLPIGWNKYPSPDILKKIGNAWLQNQSSLLLFVPSAIDPFSQNVLINPLHTEANLLTVKEISPFTFDDRLLK